MAVDKSRWCPPVGSGPHSLSPWTSCIQNRLAQSRKAPATQGQSKGLLWGQRTGREEPTARDTCDGLSQAVFLLGITCSIFLDIQNKFFFTHANREIPLSKVVAVWSDVFCIPFRSKQDSKNHSVLWIETHTVLWTFSQGMRRKTEQLWCY